MPVISKLLLLQTGGVSTPKTPPLGAPLVFQANHLAEVNILKINWIDQSLVIKLNQFFKISANLSLSVLCPTEEIYWIF